MPPQGLEQPVKFFKEKWGWQQGFHQGYEITGVKGPSIGKVAGVCSARVRGTFREVGIHCLGNTYHQVNYS